MQTRTNRRSAMVGVLVLGFVGVWLIAACGADETSTVSSNPSACPSGTGCDLTECAADVEKPCKRFKIQLQGDPTNNVDTRRKYKAAFGSACYMSADVIPTFNCFYKKVEGKGQACEHAQKVAEVFGAAPYATGYKCQEVPGTNKENYTLQVGPDAVHVVQIDLLDAPLQNPLIEVDAVPTIAVNGPYRNLPEPQKVGLGEPFSEPQKALILEVNRKNNGGEIHSDLAGFEYPCDGSSKPMCKEPLVLQVARPNDPDAAQVHHVVRANDQRCCPWGTNSNINAAVISRKLNRYLWYRYPTAAEVLQINQVTPYPP